MPFFVSTGVSLCLQPMFPLLVIFFAGRTPQIHRAISLQPPPRKTFALAERFMCGSQAVCISLKSTHALSFAALNYILKREIICKKAAAKMEIRARKTHTQLFAAWEIALPSKEDGKCGTTFFTMPNFAFAWWWCPWIASYEITFLKR